jgi:hypothetical protein
VKRPNDNGTRHRWMTVLSLPLLLVVGDAAGSHFDPGPWSISLAGWLQLLCVGLVMTFMVRWNPGMRHDAIHVRHTMRRNPQA